MARVGAELSFGVLVRGQALSGLPKTRGKRFSPVFSRSAPPRHGPLPIFPRRLVPFFTYLVQSGSASRRTFPDFRSAPSSSTKIPFPLPRLQHPNDHLFPPLPAAPPYILICIQQSSLHPFLFVLTAVILLPLSPRAQLVAFPLPAYTNGWRNIF